VLRHLAANNSSFAERRLGRISDDQFTRQCDCVGFNGYEDHGDDRPNHFVSGCSWVVRVVGVLPTELAIVETANSEAIRPLIPK